MGSPVRWDADAVVLALRNTVGDPATSPTNRWTDTEMDSYYNRGQLQVVLDSEYVLETEWTTTLADGQREYKLPDAFYKAESVHYVFTAGSDIRELRYVSREEYRSWWSSQDELNESEPLFYYIWRKLGNDPTSGYQPTSVYLHPTPGANEDNKTLRVDGYKLPDLVSNSAGTALVELPGPYVEAAIMYAASIVKSDEGMLGEADRFLNRYEMQVEKIRGSLARRDLSSVSMLHPKGGRRHRRVGSHPTPIRW